MDWKKPLDFSGNPLDGWENSLYFWLKGTDTFRSKVQMSFVQRYRPLSIKGTDLFDSKVQMSFDEKYRNLSCKGTDTFVTKVQGVLPKVQGVSQNLQGVAPKVRRVAPNVPRKTLSDSLKCLDRLRLITKCDIMLP